jgi:hypothetical protein
MYTLTYDDVREAREARGDQKQRSNSYIPTQYRPLVGALLLEGWK